MAFTARSTKKSGPLKSAAGVEKDFVVRIGECRVDVGREFFNARALRESGELVVTPPRQDRIRHQGKVVTDFDAALIADGADAADQVLIGAHASSDAVHDDADVFHASRASWRAERASVNAAKQSVIGFGKGEGRVCPQLPR